MLTCQDPACLGWTLLPTDSFCSWCGGRLVELEVSFEFKHGEEWLALDPPVLNRERRPALRVLVRHTGDAGSALVQADDVRSEAAWLGLDTLSLKPTTLGPGESVSVGISRLKVPGKEDSVQEARIQVEVPGSPGVAPLAASRLLEFSPPPQFSLDLATQEVLLLPDSQPIIDGVLSLVRGHVWLETPPEFTGTWAELELADPVSYPLELDARRLARIPIRLKVRPDTAQDLRESASAAAEGLKRRANLRLRCTDRGTRNRSAEALPLDVPLEVGFVLGPELLVTPFPESRRLDYDLLRRVSDHRPVRLLLSNGPPRARGRLDLVIHQLEIDVPWLSCPEAPPLPWRIPTGESLELLLQVGAVQDETATLSFVSNDPLARPCFLRVRTREASEYPGWLVVDLGTTNTCAALVDENRRVEMLALDSEAHLRDERPLGVESEPRGPETMPSVLCYLELAAAHRYRVGTWAWEQAGHAAAARAVVSGAKRRLGDSEFRFEVVPVDEPARTVLLTPARAMRDLYAHVVEKAMEHLTCQGRADVVLRRCLITHPSRFSMHQIEELKTAVREAMEAQRQRFAPHFEPCEEPATLHEPVGAALHFLNDWRSHAPLHEAADQDELSYHLLVYDYGGGTLDVTLLRIQSQRRLRSGAASAESLAERLTRHCWERCQAVLRRETGVQVDLPGEDEELAAGNSFVLGQFVDSCLRAAAEAAPDWKALAQNAQVNEKVMLCYRLNGTPRERVFSRAELLSGLTDVASGEHPYSYVVTPTVLGATGQRWMGGEDVTAVVRDLLVQRLLRAVRLSESAGKIELPSDDSSLSARTNRNTLRLWAERLKVALASGATEDELRTTFQNLTFSFDGQERMLPGSLLFKQAGAPSLDEVQEPVRPRLLETVEVIRRLLASHALEQPDVLLRVGKASKLPVVDEVLRKAFPASRYVTPEEAKECVVKGASTTHMPGRVGTGVQISAGTQRPSVRVRLARNQQSLTATTSRLGIKVFEAGQAYFHELVGAGVAIPPEGKTVTVSGLVLHPGMNVLPVLENTGLVDRMLDEQGRPNPDIQSIRQFEIEVPEEMDPFELEEVELTFRVLPDLSLRLSLALEGRDQMELEPIAATDYGRGY
ncbi:hypothetical protein DYH09_21325 [bacterium CPR1]|nr:hypothetical protein [bacterium CPR1]